MKIFLNGVADCEGPMSEFMQSGGEVGLLLIAGLGAFALVGRWIR